LTTAADTHRVFSARLDGRFGRLGTTLSGAQRLDVLAQAIAPSRSRAAAGLPEGFGIGARSADRNR
jgi:hypothetical protein